MITHSLLFKVEVGWTKKGATNLVSQVQVRHLLRDAVLKLAAEALGSLVVILQRGRNKTGLGRQAATPTDALQPTPDDHAHHVSQ